jgi:membrane protein
MVALLVWVYASAQIFLFGAEVTWIYAQRHGSRIGRAGQRPG